jgi:hypothetical protein
MPEHAGRPEDEPELGMAEKESNRSTGRDRMSSGSSRRLAPLDVLAIRKSPAACLSMAPYIGARRDQLGRANGTSLLHYH